MFIYIFTFCCNKFTGSLLLKKEEEKKSRKTKSNKQKKEHLYWCALPVSSDFCCMR